MVSFDPTSVMISMQEGEFRPDPAGKLCVTVPIILAAIFIVVRVMLYCVWLSDHAVEVRGLHIPFGNIILSFILDLVWKNQIEFLKGLI